MELHPSLAKGNIDGLVTPGSIDVILSILSVGAFNSIYLDCLAFKTDLRRKLILFKIAFFSSEILGDTAKTASDFKITSTSFKLFLKRVLPLETISTIASANPIFEQFQRSVN